MKKKKKKEEEEEEEKKKKKAEVFSPPAEKPAPYLEVWQSDEGAVELGPGGTSHNLTFSFVSNTFIQ